MRHPALRLSVPLLLLAACAIQEPPPGGPEDKAPPEVLSTVPENGAAGVSPSGEIAIEFSEKMLRRNLERRVQFSPASSIGKVGWRGNTLVLEPRPPLHPDTTFIVELGAGVADYHGVRTDKPYRFAFSTSAAIDTGVVAGLVHFRRRPTPNALVRLWVFPLDSSFVASAARPQREAHVNDEGEFELDYLPMRGERLIVWAFEDANSNGSFDVDNEAGALLEDTLALAGELTQSRHHNIYIVDPREPAEVSGIVVNNSGDSSLVAVTMRELADSLPQVFYTRCDPEGRFTLAPLRGAYMLTAFMDVLPDSLCGTYPCADDSTRRCQEPCVSYPDTVVVAPGDKVQLEELILGPPREEKE